MAVSTSTAPELTAEQVAKILVKPLEATSTFLAAGPRIYDTAGPLRLPKLGGATSPAWFGENEQITPEVDPTFDEVELLPSTIKSVKTLTRFSNELARQSVIALDAALKERVVKDVADTLDAQFWSASDGATNTLPRGIFNYAGQTMSGVGAITLDDLHDAVALAMAANVNVGNLRWVFTSGTLTTLRKIKESTGSNKYALQPDARQGNGFQLLGIPVVVTNRLAVTDGDPDTANGLLYDPSQIAVARDLAPSVKVLDQTFGDYDQMALRVTSRYDVAPLNDEAVIALTGITI